MTDMLSTNGWTKWRASRRDGLDWSALPSRLVRLPADDVAGNPGIGARIGSGTLRRRGEPERVWPIISLDLIGPVLGPRTPQRQDGRPRHLVTSRGSSVRVP